jgi:predicted permease
MEAEAWLAVDSMYNDLRFAFRTLLKQPGFTAVAVLVLALGVGGNTAMFSLANALLLRPLEATHPEQLVGCYSKDKNPKAGYRGFSYPNYVDIREKNTVFNSLLAFDFALAGIKEGDTTRRVFASVVSANYFSTFGVKVALGRDFLPAEERPGSATPVAIISCQYWKRMGSPADVARRKLVINGRSYQIIGVAPEHFTGTAAFFAPELWVPLGMYEALYSDLTNQEKRSLSDRNHHFLCLVGRLKAGLAAAPAQAQLATLADQMEKAYPAENKDQTFVLARLPRVGITTNPHSDTAELSALSLLLMSLSGVVLLIACLNLANMLLARGTARRREMAIRLALGGGRTRIVRQLLTEGLILSLLGGAAGLLLARWTTNLLVASLIPRIPMFNIVFEASLDLRVLAATFAFCVLATILFGLGPAWKLSRLEVVTNLKEQAGEDRRASAGLSLFAPRQLLVIGQMALSLALVTTAGLFIRTAQKAGQAGPGYRLENVLLVEVDPSLAGYDEQRGRQLYGTLLERLSSLPGVESVSMSSCVPFGLLSDGCQVKKVGETRPANASTNLTGDEVSARAILNIIGTDYFRTLAMPLLRGRDFHRLEAESATAAKVAIIDEPLARKLWPGEDALGQRLNINGKKDGEQLEVLEVVGVAPGLRHEPFDKEPCAHVYVPFGQRYRANMNFHLRVAGAGHEAEKTMLGTVRQEMRAVDDRLPVLSLTTLRGHRDDGLLLWFARMGARVFTAFGGLALFLAVVGVYGVKAYVVARRTHEIGIRMALGATGRDVLWLVLRQGLNLTLAGLGAGFLLALAAGRLLSSKLYEVSPTDPLTFTIAPLLLTAAAMLACYLPARRAMRTDPMVALRYE